MRYDETLEDQALLPALGPDRLPVLEPGETVLATLTARGLALYRDKLASDRCYFRTSEVPIRLTLSSTRLLLTCDKFERGGGWRSPSPGMMLAANAISKARAASRTRGRVLVGQMRLRWIARLGYQERHNRKSANTVRLVAQDASGPSVLVEITLDKHTSPHAFTQAVLDAAVAVHQGEPRRLTAEQQDALASLSLPRFEPASGQLAIVDIPAALVVARETAFPRAGSPA